MNSIRIVRIYRRISRKEISERVGIDLSTLARYERNEREPNLAILHEFAASLSVRTIDLFDDFETGLAGNLSLETFYRKPFNSNGPEPLYRDNSFTIKNSLRKALIQAVKRFHVCYRRRKDLDNSDIGHRQIIKRAEFDTDCLLSKEHQHKNGFLIRKDSSLPGVILPSIVFDSQSGHSSKY